MRNCPLFKMTHTCFIKTFSDSLLVSENLRLSNSTLLRITAFTVLEFRYPTWGHLYDTPLFTSFFWAPVFSYQSPEQVFTVAPYWRGVQAVSARIANLYTVPHT